MLKKLTWTLAILIVVVLIYAGIKYLQYSSQWRQFDTARQNVDRLVKASIGYNWEPGVFSASGEMDISDRQIDDDQLETLIQLLSPVSTLFKVDFSDNALTDAAIPQLAELSGLRKLVIRGNQITGDGLVRLKAALPNCEIGF